MDDSNNTHNNLDFSNKKILIVEDTESNYKLLMALLKPTKAELILAEHGKAAIEYCKTIVDIHLVLMDIRLPDINGLEITRRIKELRKDLPVIAQTAFAMSDDREKCLEAGCDEYISKPISKTDFLALVAKHLNNK